MAISRFDAVPQQQELLQVLPLPVRELLAMNQPLIQEWNNRRDQISGIQAMRGQLNSLSAIDNAREDEEISQIIQPILDNVELNPDYLKSQRFQTDLARQINNFNYTGFQNRRLSKEQYQAQLDQIQKLLAQGRYNPLIHGTLDELSLMNGSDNVFTSTPLNPYVSIEEEFDPILSKVQPDTYTREENGRIFKYVNRDMNKLNQLALDYVSVLPNSDSRLRGWLIEAGIVNRTDDAETSAYKINQLRQDGSLLLYLSPRIEQVGRRYLLDKDQNKTLVDYTPWVKELAKASLNRTKNEQRPLLTVFQDTFAKINKNRDEKVQQYTNLFIQSQFPKGIPNNLSPLQQQELLQQLSNVQNLVIADDLNQLDGLLKVLLDVGSDPVARRNLLEVVSTRTQNPITEYFKEEFTLDRDKSKYEKLPELKDGKGSPYAYAPNSNIRTILDQGQFLLSSRDYNVPVGYTNDKLNTKLAGNKSANVRDAKIRHDIQDLVIQKFNEYLASSLNVYISPGKIVDYDGFNPYGSKILNEQQQIIFTIPEEDYKKILNEANDTFDTSWGGAIGRWYNTSDDDLLVRENFFGYNRAKDIRNRLEEGGSKLPVKDLKNGYVEISMTAPFNPSSEAARNTIQNTSITSTPNSRVYNEFDQR